MPTKAPTRISRTSSKTSRPTTKASPPSKAKPIVRELTGLSLKQLLKATPPYIQANAQEVIIRELKPAVSRGGFPGVKSKILSVGNRGVKHQYRATIVGKEVDTPLYKQKHVMVSCECGFFLYYCEYALTHWGSSSIKYSNGEAPVHTNPGLLPLMCKHLTQLAKTVITHKM